VDKATLLTLLLILFLLVAVVNLSRFSWIHCSSFFAVEFTACALIPGVDSFNSPKRVRKWVFASELLSCPSDLAIFRVRRDEFRKKLHALNIAKSEGQLNSSEAKTHFRTLLGLLNESTPGISAHAVNSTAKKLEQCIQENLDRFTTATNKKSISKSVSKVALSTLNYTIEKVLLKKTENPPAMRRPISDPESH
jgi:hypothetical protein